VHSGKKDWSFGHVVWHLPEVILLRIAEHKRQLQGRDQCGPDFLGRAVGDSGQGSVWLSEGWANGAQAWGAGNTLCSVHLHCSSAARSRNLVLLKSISGGQ
jgi:hypothetical protein